MRRGPCFPGGRRALGGCSPDVDRFGRLGLVRRARRRAGSRLRAFQRCVGTLLLPGDPAPGRRPARLRQRRRPRRVPGAGPHARPGPERLRCPDSARVPRPAHGTPLPQRPRYRPGREPLVALRRRDRTERPARRRLRLRRGGGRHRQRRLGRSARDELRVGSALPQRGRRDVHRRVAPGRRRCAERVRRFGGVRRLRPGRLAGSVHRQQRRLRPRQPHRVPQHGGGARLLSAGNVRRAARPPLSKPGQRCVRRRQPDGAPARQYRRGLARDAGPVRTRAGRGHRRLRRRRLARYLRRQRRHREPALDQPAGRHAHGRRPALRRGAERSRHARGRHGGGCRRLRRRRRRRPVHDAPDDRGKQPLRQRRLRDVPGRERGVPAGTGQPALHRLGLGVVRLRQRRPARRHGGQRHGGGGGRARRRPVPVRAAQHAVPQSGRPALRGRHGAGRCGVPTVGGESRRRVRGHRQRRGYGRAGRQQHRSRTTARQHDRQPPALAGPAAGGGRGG